MLRIRQEQLDALDARSLEAFLDRAADFVAENWSEEYREAGREAVRRSARTLLERCENFGIEAERELLRLLNITYALGEGFEDSGEYPWAREILTDDSLDPEDKLEELERRTEDELGAS